MQSPYKNVLSNCIDYSGTVLSRNKHKISRAEIQQIAQELVDEMEIAADRDLQLHGDGEVALEKLKLIPKLEETLIRRDFQKILLAQGILGVYGICFCAF